VDTSEAFGELTAKLATGKSAFILAELNDLLTACAGERFASLPRTRVRGPVAESQGTSAQGVACSVSTEKYLHRFQYWREGLKTLNAPQILRLFAALNYELAQRLCLVFHAREATRDIDALLVPAAELRLAAQTVSGNEGLPDNWLNDAVKGFPE